MASAGACLNKITKADLRAELKAMIAQRMKDKGISQNDFRANAAVREVTKVQLAINAEKRRAAAIQAHIIKGIAEDRFAPVKGRNASIQLDAAATAFEFDVKGRFNKVDNTDHMERVNLAKMYNALDIDNYRAKWTEAVKKVFTGKAFADDVRHGFDKEGTLAFINAKLGKKSTPEMEALVKRMDEAYKVGFADNRAAGGKVGWLEHYLPHPYKSEEWLTRGKATMTDMLMRNADRALMLDEAGVPYSEAELRRMAEHTYESVSSKGMNELSASDKSMLRVGGLRSSRANARDAGRKWHFTADGYLDMMQTMHGNSMFELMLNDMRALAHDTAFLQVLGPNELQTVTYMKNALRVASPDQKGIINANKFQDLYDTVTGKKSIPYDTRVAEHFATARTAISGTKLGSAFLHSALIGDTITTFTRLIAKNHMGIGSYLSELTRALQNKDADTAFYRSQRFIWDARYYGMMDVARTEGDSAFAKRQVANATKSVLESSLLERGPMSEIIARQADLMARFTDHADKAFADLPKSHQEMLKEYGVDKHWDTVRAATKMEATSTNPYKGLDYNHLYTTADGAKAADRFQAMLIGEAKATIYNEPTARVSQMLSFERGTIKGELARSVFQFGQWPLLAWRSMMGPLMGDASIMTKAKYGASVVVGGLISGYLGMVANDLLAGRTPAPLDDPRTWLAAGLKANLAANFGDMAVKVLGLDDPFRTKWSSYKDFTQSLTPASVFNLSPILSTIHGIGSGIGQLNKTSVPLISELMHDFGAPLGLQLWYTKTAYERLVVQNIEMMLDPEGYNARQSRAVRGMTDRGQSYWLPPPS